MDKLHQAEETAKEVVHSEGYHQPNKPVTAKSTDEGQKRVSRVEFNADGTKFDDRYDFTSAVEPRNSNGSGKSSPYSPVQGLGSAYNGMDKKILYDLDHLEFERAASSQGGYIGSMLAWQRTSLTTLGRASEAGGVIDECGNLTGFGSAVNGVIIVVGYNKKKPFFGALWARS